MEPTKLPASTTGALDELSPDDVPVCPWCRRDPGEATVTLNQICEAQEAGNVLGFVERAPDGTAPRGSLEVDCPWCVRPFVIVLQSRAGWRYVRLLPVRTPTDAKMLREGGR
ncbi:hypothetical protein [Phenylobacterium sp.]|uniref:hypothetical protein n=1 Tax=Phenylobacterium sp. TaxID=1871053 RepID=UPI00392CA964